MVKLVIKDWEYVSSSGHKFKSNEFESIIDSSYMSMNQFLTIVIDALRNEFKDENRAQGFESVKGQILTPELEKPEQVIADCHSQVIDFITSHDKDAKVKIDYNSGDMIINVDSTLSDDDIKELINNNLDELSTPFNLRLFKKGFNINAVIEFYKSFPTEMSQDEKRMFKSNMDKFDIERISSIFKDGKFTMKPLVAK